MRVLMKILGLILIVGIVIAGCDSVTDSELSDVESQSEILTLEAGEGQWQGNKANSAKSLGKITFNTEVSSWDIGDGNPNGEFVTAEVQGVVIGLRAMERFEGLLGVTGDNGNRVGVYEAETGPSPRSAGDNNGTWNYDWHVDLSGAKGNVKGKTLDDYRLVFEQNFTNQSLFGLLGSDPVILALDGDHACTDNYGTDTPPGEIGVDLCQQSWNPGFGNDDFEPNAEATYNLRLVLTPETFNGPPLAVAIKVNVTE